jgi:hypothetical protein
MSNPGDEPTRNQWPTLAAFPRPAKALVSVVILTFAVAMTGALGQIIVHDIIPTFYSDQSTGDLSTHTLEDMNPPMAGEESEAASGRGDLFSDASVVEKSIESEQFVWTLKWTHIHLFGMNMIFIFMGAITIFLNVSLKVRTWFVILPFVGVLLDITTMWLKAFISPVFFWLHIPGGGLFGAVFAIVSVRALWEMWAVRKNYA